MLQESQQALFFAAIVFLLLNTAQQVIKSCIYTQILPFSSSSVGGRRFDQRVDGICLIPRSIAATFRVVPLPRVLLGVHVLCHSSKEEFKHTMCHFHSCSNAERVASCTIPFAVEANAVHNRHK